MATIIATIESNVNIIAISKAEIRISPSVKFLCSSRSLETAFTHQGFGILLRVDLLKTRNQQNPLINIRNASPNIVLL